MSRDPKQFQISDDEGIEHVYTFIPLPAGKGVKVLRRVLKPLIAAASQGMSALGDLSAPNLDGVDSARLAEAAGNLVDILGDTADDNLFKQIFADAMRTSLVDGGKKKTLKVDQQFDHIYQGNYGELMLAVYHAFKVNFGPALARFAGNLQTGPLFDKARATLESKLS
ncbi:MAG: hypothetical protein KAI73_03800 [Rhodospirillaceae bacterium]|nr:hypothetical protein [Rhodospirillaceae bacterium]